jgi:hypothetical protein
MQIGLDLSFKTGAIDGNKLLKLFRQFYGVQPVLVTRKYKTEEWDEKKHLKIINKYDGEFFLFFDDRNGNTFSISPTGMRCSYLFVSIKLDSRLFLPVNEEIDEISNLWNGFISGYIYNEEYVFVQSEVFENNLNSRDISKENVDTIKATPYKLGLFDKKEYEVRFNPGRRKLIGCTCLMAAWKIWLGTPFFELVPKANILAFKYAREIKDFASGSVYIQLFENWQESHTTESMFRQWKWQECLNYDELIDKYR